MSTVILTSWGITQWIALVPLILRERSKGNPNIAKGLVVTGCVGVLLSSACAGLSLR